MRRPEFRGLTCFSNLSYTNSVFVRPISVFVTTNSVFVRPISVFVTTNPVFVTTNPVFVHTKTGLVLQILGLSFIRVIKTERKTRFFEIV